MNTSMIMQLPAVGSSQPLLSLYTRHYQESVQKQPCPLLFYEFYGTEDLITYIPNGCMDFLLEENNMTYRFFQPFAAYENTACIPGCRYFGVRFPTGILPSRHFQPDYFATSLLRLSSFKERISCFCQSFRPEQHCMSVSEPVQYMLEQLCMSSGTTPIHALATDLNYSERHIHRMFLSHMGYSPKLYSRIIRFQSALQEMIDAPEKSNSGFIRNLGYSDQAHFQREFKEFTGITPRQFIHLFLATTASTSGADLLHNR